MEDVSAILKYYATFEVMQVEDHKYVPHLDEVRQGHPTNND